MIHNYKILFRLPIYFACGFILFTYLFFWTTEYAMQFEFHEVLYMSTVVLLSIASLFIGFKLYILKIPVPISENHLGNDQIQEKMDKIVFCASIYLLFISLALMYEHNNLNFNSLKQAFTNPGEAYRLKRFIYEQQAETNSSNFLLQILTILSVYYYIGITATFYYWHFLSSFVKAVSIIGITFYCFFFISIGTQKGIGDIVFLGCAGILLRYVSYRFCDQSAQKIKFTPPLKRWPVLLAVVLVFYMGFNQESRAQTYDFEETAYRHAYESFWGKIFDIETARKINSINHYTSISYAGLTYALQQDFVFSYGYGICPAIHKYLQQYLGMENCYDMIYLARSEVNTGWPAKRYWSTLIAWLASDLTPVGAIFAMGLIGWCLGWAWYHALSHDLIGLIVFGELTIVIFYFPANNQLLASRTGLWSVIGTLFLLLIRQIFQRKNEQNKKDCGPTLCNAK